MLLKVSNDNVITVDWFLKKKFSGRYLSYFSNHPICHKIGTIYKLVDKAILLSQPMFHQNNLKICIEMLSDNSYPLDLIFKEINRRIKKLLNKKSAHKDAIDNVTHDVNANSKKFFVTPYIRNISETTATLINKTEFTIGYRCLNNLKNFVKAHKDKTDFNTNNNIIYKICCKNCDASYIGQTTRHLKTRVKKHVKSTEMHRDIR